jgi:hypothetical protein
LPRTRVDASGGDGRHARVARHAVQLLCTLRVHRVVADVQVGYARRDRRLQHAAALAALERAGRVHHEVCPLQRRGQAGGIVDVNAAVRCLRQLGAPRDGRVERLVRAGADDEVDAGHGGQQRGGGRRPHAPAAAQQHHALLARHDRRGRRGRRDGGRVGGALCRAPASLPGLRRA